MTRNRIRTLAGRTAARLWGKNGRPLLAILAVFLLTRLLAAHRPLTESVYARGIYPVIAAVTGFVSDLFPFSLQELGIAALLAFLIYKFLKGIVLIRRGRTTFRQQARGGLRRVYVLAAAGYCLFYLLWGFNYFRLRLVDRPEFRTAAPDRPALIALLTDTIHEANRLHAATLPDWTAVNRELNRRLDSELRRFAGSAPTTADRIKHFLIDWLSPFGTGGITLPWLHEAHLAGDLFPFERPFIAAHEKSHLKGRTEEAEANFFAWLACIGSDIPAVRYSGHFSLLGYLFGALPAAERTSFHKALAPGVLAHVRLQRERARRRSRTLLALSRGVNNLYLKANRVSGGVANYSGVVRLALHTRRRLPDNTKKPLAPPH